MDDITNSSVLAADTTNLQAGGSSFFPSIEDVGDAVTKGIGAAAVSGLASIYNTGVAAANYFGADAEKIDVKKTLTDVDQNWGQYYSDHQGIIDTAGFLATSFIPGGLAVKGLNLLRRGEAAGALGRALNFTTDMQTASLEKALQTIASPEGSVFTRLNGNYLQAIAWGTADSVLQSAAFEVGVAATMTASPLLDGASAKDLAHDIIKNALFGGLVGGGIEALFMNGITKRAIATVDKKGAPYSSLGGVEGIGFADASDRAYAIIGAMQKLPEAVAKEDASLPFTYTLHGRENVVEGGLQTKALYTQKLQKTLDEAYLKVEGLITNKIALAGDATVGRPMAKVLLDILKQGKNSATGDDDIVSRMGDYLLNLKRAEPIGESALGDVATIERETLHSFDKNAKGTEFPLRTVGEAEPQAGDVLYRVKGDPGELKVAVLGKDAKSQRDAWSQGYDMTMNPDGGWAINPKSASVRPTKTPSGFQGILNTVSGEVTSKSSVTAADIATADSPLIVTGDGVVSGSKTWKFSTDDGFSEQLGQDSTDFTARHAWANSLKKIEGDVNGTDFSVLDKMANSPKIVSEDTTITVGTDTRNWREWGNFQDFVFNNKVAELAQRFQSGEQDIQKLAYEFNTTPDWIQNLVASKFQTSLNRLASNAPDLSTGWQRPLTDYLDRENLLLTYQKPNPAMYSDLQGAQITNDHFSPSLSNQGGGFVSRDGTQFITGQLAYQYRVKLAQENVDMAISSVFGSDASKFIDFTAEDLEGLANRNTTGAGLLSFSNADYGDKLRVFSQYTGKVANQLIQQISDTNLSRLQPFFSMFKNDPIASAELTAIVTRLRTSTSRFQLLGTEYGLDGAYLVDKSLLKGSVPETLAAIKEAAVSGTEGNFGQKAFHIESDLVRDFLTTHQQINSDLIQKRSVLSVSMGQTSNKDPGNLYVPPVDSSRVPYFAFVRSREGKAFSDSNVSMITARSSGELQTLAAKIEEDSGLQVIFKGQSEDFHKATGDYNYGRSLNESQIDNTLRSEGKLGDFLPSFNVESTLEDFLNWHQRQAAQLVRDGISTKYAQPFAELSRLGEDFTQAAKSKFEPLNKLFNRTVENPYDDVIKEALNLSKRSEFTLLDKTNEILDAMGTRAYRAGEDAFKKAAAGTATWEDANSTMTKYGLGKVFQDQAAFDLANIPADRNLLKIALQKANSFLSTFTLRLDAAHAIVHTISSPIMLGLELSAIRNSITKNAEATGALNELRNIEVPGGGGLGMPSSTRLIANGIKAWWEPEANAFHERLQGLGISGNLPADFYTIAKDLSIVPSAPGKFLDAVDKAVEFGAKWTGNNFAEEFSRFVSAHVMKQLTDPLIARELMTVQEQGAFMNSFVNRVQGNYLTSQRPILFQGTLGSALGLFQTYHLNMLQQIFRHVEDRNWAALATGAALQTSIFGLDGLPLFNGINTNLIGNASINTGHHDAYSSAVQAGGKAMGDWLLYGSASALPIFGAQGPALYSRGQIAPRNLTVIPVTPMEIPAVDATAKFVRDIYDTGNRIANGAPLGASLLQGLEHNSINRPLAGIAQIAQGFSTTSQGQLIAQNQDLFSIGNASRILGAKPLDEAVGLNTKFRLKSYQAEDQQRVEQLGEAVKSTLVGNKVPTDEQMIDFMGKYTAAGGRPEMFGRKLQEWSKAANTSVLNELSDKVRSPYGQRFVEAMGGTRLPDFVNNPNQPDPTQVNTGVP